MTRSIRKGPFIDQHLQVKVDEMNKKSDRKVMRMSRSHREMGMPWSAAARDASSSSLPGITPSCMPRRFWYDASSRLASRWASCRLRMTSRRSSPSQRC